METASQSSPWTNTFPAGASVVCSNSDFADQSLFAGDNLVAAGAHGDAHQECRDDSERNADGERGHETNAHFGNGRVDQKQSAQGQQDNSACGEHAVAGELGFSGEQREGAR